MRFVTAFALVLGVTLAGCGGNAADDSSPPGTDLSLPADCPTGFQSPTYCFAGAGGTGNSCGACSHVGELCDYFEATLICAGDHEWRCYWAGGSSGGCKHADGGT